MKSEHSAVTSIKWDEPPRHRTRPQDATADLWRSHFFFVLCALLVALSVTARASPSCATLAEARAAYPGKHLYWHGPRRCWDDRGLGRAAVSKPVRPTLPPAQINDAPAPTILYPTLVMDMDPPDPALLAPAPATAGPLLLDVDEITGQAIDANANKATPRVESSFRDRWLAMPASWFLAAIAERVK